MRFLHIFLMAAIACNLAACGTKGKLKTPSQVEADQEKKERKAAKKAEQEKKEKAEQEAKEKEAAPEAKP